MALTTDEAIERERDRVWMHLLDIGRDAIGDKVATRDDFTRVGIASQYAAMCARATRAIVDEDGAIAFAREALELLDHEDAHRTRVGLGNDPRKLAEYVPPR